MTPAEIAAPQLQGLPHASAMQGKLKSAWIALELALLLMVANDLGDRPMLIAGRF